MKKLGWEGAWNEFKKGHIRPFIIYCAWVLLAAFIVKSSFMLIFGGVVVASFAFVTLLGLAVMLRCSCNKLVNPRYNYCPWCAREVPQELKARR